METQGLRSGAISTHNRSSPTYEQIRRSYCPLDRALECRITSKHLVRDANLPPLRWTSTVEQELEVIPLSLVMMNLCNNGCIVLSLSMAFNMTLMSPEQFRPLFSLRYLRSLEQSRRHHISSLIVRRSISLSITSVYTYWRLAYISKAGGPYEPSIEFTERHVLSSKKPCSFTSFPIHQPTLHFLPFTNRNSDLYINDEKYSPHTPCIATASFQSSSSRSQPPSHFSPYRPMTQS